MTCQVYSKGSLFGWYWNWCYVVCINIFILSKVQANVPRNIQESVCYEFFRFPDQFWQMLCLFRGDRHLKWHETVLFVSHIFACGSKSSQWSVIMTSLPVTSSQYFPGDSYVTWVCLEYWQWMGNQNKLDFAIKQISCYHGYLFTIKRKNTCGCLRETVTFVRQ